MDALTYVRSSLKKLGITDVSVKKLGRGNFGTYAVGSTKPYPQSEAEKISAEWTQKAKSSGMFSGAHDEKWGWAGKDDYYPYIIVVIDPQKMTKRPSKLQILSGKAATMATNNTGNGYDSGPQPSDPGSHYRLTSQTYIAVHKVKKAIDDELTFISQMDKADTAKQFVKLIAACRSLSTQIDDALQVSRSSGQFRRRPGFSAMIDVWVKSGVLLQVAINDLQIAGSIAGSAKYTPERKLAVQKKLLKHASTSIESMRDNLHSQMLKFGNYDPEQLAPRNA